MEETNEINEVKKEVKSFNVDYKCDQCETGYMRPDGRVLLSNPPKYPHICNNMECSGKMTSRTKYPYIAYEEINADSDGK